MCVLHTFSLINDTGYTALQNFEFWVKKVILGVKIDHISIPEG